VDVDVDFDVNLNGNATIDVVAFREFDRTSAPQSSRCSPNNASFDYPSPAVKDEAAPRTTPPASFDYSPAVNGEGLAAHHLR